MQQKNAALRKRSQIAKANKTMFITIAVVSVIVGFASVASMFLFQKLTFNEKILKEKGNTVSILKANNANIEELKNLIRVLDTNQVLESLKTSTDSSAVQVVLDALPSDANSSALGASLQNVLLNVPGVTIESLDVKPVDGVESLSSDSTTVSGTSAGTSTTTAITTSISFTASVTGDSTALKTLLQKFEKSIRTIQVDSLKIENQTTVSGASLLNMSINGRAFYQAEKSIELKDKVVKS